MDWVQYIPTDVSFSGAIVILGALMYRMVTSENKYSRANVKIALFFMGPVMSLLAIVWAITTFI